MTGLNENHKRRLLAAFKHTDDLLTQSLNAVSPASLGLYRRCFQDISPSELHWIESYVEKIREQVLNLLERFNIELPSPSTPASWILRTNLTFLDMTLGELYPEELRGYGEMDKTTASDLTWTLQAIRRLLSQLFAFLAESKRSGEIQISRLQAEPALSAMLKELSQIVARHRLVEFLPALNSITRKLEAHRYEIAVFGRVSSGKSSLINRLLEIQLLPVGATPITAVPIHIVGSQESRLRVTFMDRTVVLGVDALPEFATEQGNPANTKRVVAIEVAVPSQRLQEGIAFVDTPGIASLATSGTKLAYAYLPDSDFGIVLIDSQSTLGRDDLDILRALHSAGIPSVVMISKCDLLTPQNMEKVLSYTRSAIAEHLGYSIDVVPISSVDSWMPDVEKWFQTTISPLLKQARESLVISMNRKMQLLRNSLVATLEVKASHTVDAGDRSQESEQMLRPIDESLEEFDSRWRDKIEDILQCKDEVLETAAIELAQASENHRTLEHNPVSILVDALIRSVAARCNPFLVEYQSLSEEIAERLGELRKNDSESEIQYYESPKPSELPAPILSLLDGVVISEPAALMGISRAMRERHFRKELREKAAGTIEKVLNEFTPRLRHWYQSTVNALKDGYHIQADLLRYRGQGTKSDISADVLRKDIERLKTSFTNNEGVLNSQPMSETMPYQEIAREHPKD